MAMVNRPLPVLFDPFETVRLKDKDGRLIDYRERANTEQMRRTLTTINDALRATSVEFDAPGAVTDGYVLRCGEQVLYPHMQFLWRVFNHSKFSLGGRFYGGFWQTVKSRDRAYLRIDGEPTLEHDYPQLHPLLLYALAGKKLSGDAYTIDGWDRSLAKKAFNILLNASTFNAALRAIANEIGGVGAMSKAAALMEAVKGQHKPVAEYFHSGIGLRLQRNDADIAEDVMLRSLTDGIIALPIHDSFIVQSRYGDQLKAIMDDALFSAFPALRTTAYPQMVPHMAGGGGLVCVVLPLPDQGDLFPVRVTVPFSDFSWRHGLVPEALRYAVRYEIRRRGLALYELARHVGISASQMSNALRGRYGLGEAAAERLKNFVLEAAS